MRPPLLFREKIEHETDLVLARGLNDDMSSAVQKSSIIAIPDDKVLSDHRGPSSRTNSRFRNPQLCEEQAGRGLNARVQLWHWQCIGNHGYRGKFRSPLVDIDRYLSMAIRR